MNKFSTTSCPSSLLALSSLRAKLTRLTHLLKWTARNNPHQYKTCCNYFSYICLLFCFSCRILHLGILPSPQSLDPILSGQMAHVQILSTQVSEDMSLITRNWMVKHEGLRFCQLLSVDTMIAKYRALLKSSSIKWNELCWKFKTTVNPPAFPLEMPSALFWPPTV